MPRDTSEPLMPPIDLSKPEILVLLRLIGHYLTKSGHEEIALKLAERSKVPIEHPVVL